MNGLQDMDTKLLRAMRDVCPNKPGDKVTFSLLGKSVTLTYESRQRANAELARRRAKAKAAGG
jgi:hypothetical protein